MASKSTKRSRDTGENDSDEDYTGSSSLDASFTKKQQKLTPVPAETSKWTIYDLQRVHISYSKTMFSSPDELFDQFESVRKKIPKLNEEFMKINDFMQSKLTFSYNMHELNDTDGVRLTSIVKELHGSVKVLLAKDEAYQTLQKTLKQESQFMIEKVRVAGERFLYELINFVGESLANRATPIPETVYSSLLQRFCEICNFNGSTGVPKTKREICHVDVVSIPDLVYKKPVTFKQDCFVDSGCRIISVAEVKKSEMRGPLLTEKRQTRSSSDSASEEIFVPEHVRGAYQHAAQLLLAEPDSFVPRHSLGILLNETKIIFTCLVLTKNYTRNMGKKLNAADSGVTYTCGPYDFMNANDRKVLLKSFLQLGLAQQAPDITM